MSCRSWLTFISTQIYFCFKNNRTLIYLVFYTHNSSVRLHEYNVTALFLCWLKDWNLISFSLTIAFFPFHQILSIFWVSWRIRKELFLLPPWQYISLLSVCLTKSIHCREITGRILKLLAGIQLGGEETSWVWDLLTATVLYGFVTSVNCGQPPVGSICFKTDCQAKDLHTECHPYILLCALSEKRRKQIFALKRIFQFIKWI